MFYFLKFRCGRFLPATTVLVFTLALLACGGGNNESNERDLSPTTALAMVQRIQGTMRPAQSIRPLSLTASTSRDTLPIAAEEIFAWAEWKYSNLFPAGATTQAVNYLGKVYQVRSYSNGNYLGVTGDGEVYGLGPFTGQSLQSFGTLASLAPAVTDELCTRVMICSFPQIITQPTDVSVVVGQAARFSVRASSEPKPHFRWQISEDDGQTFNDIPGATSAAYTTPLLQKSGTGTQYRVLVGNAQGWVESGAVLSTVTAGDLGKYFPTDAGSWWVYTTRTAAKDTQRIVGFQTIGQTQGVLFEYTDGMSGEITRNIYKTAPDGVRTYAGDTPDAVSRAMDGMEVIHLPFQAGKSLPQFDVTVDGGIDVDGDLINDQVRIQTSLSMIALEDLQVEAGLFRSAMHVQQDLSFTFFPSGTGGFVNGSVKIDEWYGEGIGLLKRVSSSTLDGLTDVTSYTLQSFRVGDRRSDSIAPVVRKIEPPSGSTSRAAAGILLQFSKEIDPASIGVDTLTITNSAGQRLDGKLVPYLGAQRTLSFDGAYSMPSGNYTARLNTDLRDLSGNSLLVPSTWSFVVDRTGPQLLSTNLGPDGEHVNLQPTIELRFSEPIFLFTEGFDGVKLLRAGAPIGSIGLPVDWMTQGNVLSIRPKSPLVDNAYYELMVEGAHDQYFNGVPLGYSVSFHTIGSHFLPATKIAGVPRELYDIGSKSVRISRLVDIDGDGLLDLIFVISKFGSIHNNKLYLSLGLPGGDFGSPVQIGKDSDDVCLISSVAVGDLNGDGRPDIAVGDDYCEAKIYRQTSAGRFANAEILSGPPVYVMGIAEIDKKGRNVLIGLSGNRIDELVSWRFDAGSASGAPETLVSGIRLLGDMATGDVDGDGQIDLIFTTPWYTYPDQDLVVIRRRADGGLAPPEFVDSGMRAPITALAVGDITGDGLEDIVVTSPGYPFGKVGLVSMRANGKLGPILQYPVEMDPSELALADVNGDGRVDVVVMHPTLAGSINAPSYVGVLLQRQNGSLGSETVDRLPYGGVLHVGDISGDGRLDILSGLDLLVQDSMHPVLPTSARTFNSTASRTHMRGGRLTSSSALHGLRDLAARRSHNSPGQ